MATVAEPASGLSWPRRLALASPAFIWIGLLVLAPNLILVLYSFWTNRISFVQKDFTLENYGEAFHSEVVQTLLLRTFLIALVAAVCATVIGYPLAFVVVRYFGRFKFLAGAPRDRPALGELLDAGVLMEDHPRRARDHQHLLHVDGHPRGAVGHLPLLAARRRHRDDVHRHSLVFLTSYTLLERIPPSLYEASSDCGASMWRTFWRIIWPISRPAVVIGFMLVFVLALGDYVTPTLIGGFSGTMMGSVILQAFGGLNNWPYGAALAITTMLAALLFLGATSTLLRKRVILEE